MHSEHKPFKSHAILISMANGTITLNEIYEAINRLAQKIEELDIDVHELKEEREVSSEYKKKLERISKQKGKTFGNKEEFLNYLKAT